jgi:hypothetical protein
MQRDPSRSGTSGSFGKQPGMARIVKQSRLEIQTLSMSGHRRGKAKEQDHED